jgi:hypothetical protein
MHSLSLYARGALMQHVCLPFCCLLPLIAHIAAAAAQASSVTVFQHCNFAGQSGVAAPGNYPSLASPVSLRLRSQQFKAKWNDSSAV